MTGLEFWIWIANVILAYGLYRKFKKALIRWYNYE